MSRLLHKRATIPPGKPAPAAYTGRVEHLSASDFNFLRTLFFKATGIRYGEQKKTLVETRLSHLLQPTGPYDSYHALVLALQPGGKQDLLDHVTSRMSTHYSFFFREPVHYAFLQDRLLGRWRHKTRVDILSAACAAGEEAWSCAFCAQGAWRLRHPDNPAAALPPGLHIHGVDVAPEPVRQAQAGVYPAQEVESSVSPGIRSRYFARQDDGNYRVRDSLRPLCSFAVQNLLAPRDLGTAAYDLVFMRNILIYFKADERQELLWQMHRLLRPDGYLIISLSETMTGLDLPFRHHKYSIYTKQ